MAVGLFALTLGCMRPSDPSSATDINQNCHTNLAIAATDLKQCATGAPGSCDSVRKDLQQVADDHPTGKEEVVAAQAHLSACGGRGADNDDCKAVSDAVSKLKCE